MSRAALIVALVLAAAAPPAAADPHVDRGVMLAGCAGCHEGHGASGSPMLPEPQKPICLRCHDTQAGLSAQVLAGVVAPGATPPLLSPALSQPNVHPISSRPFSSHESDRVTCTSCHSPHRAMSPGATDAAPGERRRSPKDPERFEFELCRGCHDAAGRLISPANASFHPVEAPAVERSPSVVPELAGREINCSDCHGNSDRFGPQGPHGSAVPFLLRANYVTADGSAATADAYALCYGCHDRETILERAAFPEHGEHVVKERASCATCHNPHGSVDNRALIRFGEEAPVSAVGPAAGSGRLAFVSTGPGSGACYLTCHGRSHDPETYGLPPTDPESVLHGLGLPAPPAPARPRIEPPLRPRKPYRVPDGPHPPP